MKVYGVTGWKNCGKTTLVAGLVQELTRRGLAVSTIKHAHHAFDVDQEGRDSWQHRQAGASEVLVSSRLRWALMGELRGAEELSLGALLCKLTPVDLVLIEGYKREPHPKIEAWRSVVGEVPIAASDSSVRAIACDQVPAGVTVPTLSLDDVAAVADFILSDLQLGSAGP